jgi:hypothetical protein
MRSRGRHDPTGILMVAACMAAAPSYGLAQEPGTSRTLGGYGATSTAAMAGMSGGGAIIPYAGSFGGFMPYSLGGGRSLSLGSRESSAIGSNRTSFSLSPMAGRMSSMSGGGIRGLGPRSRSFPELGTLGSIGQEGGMRRKTTGIEGQNVMPPSFGYPFYQPPRLTTTSDSRPGMSM